jgi:hypothetical protein
MTPLTKRVRRRALNPYRGRRIVVSLLPGDVLSFREERTRKEFLLSIQGAYVYAVQLEVARRLAEKRAKRKAGKK